MCSASVEFEAALDGIPVILQRALHVLARPLPGQGDLAASHRFEDQAVFLDGAVGVTDVAPEFEETDLALQCTDVRDGVDQEDVVRCFGQRVVEVLVGVDEKRQVSRR